MRVATAATLEGVIGYRLSVLTEFLSITDQQRPTATLATKNKTGGMVTFLSLLEIDLLLSYSILVVEDRYL